jgi:hypothetical protein
VASIRVSKGLPPSAGSNGTIDFRCRKVPRSLFLHTDEFDQNLYLPEHLIAPGSSHGCANDRILSLFDEKQHASFLQDRAKAKATADVRRSYGASRRAAGIEQDGPEQEQFDETTQFEEVQGSSNDVAAAGHMSDGLDETEDQTYDHNINNKRERNNIFRLANLHSDGVSIVDPARNDLSFEIQSVATTTMRTVPSFIANRGITPVVPVVRIMGLVSLIENDPPISVSLNVFNFFPYMMASSLSMNQWIDRQQAGTVLDEDIHDMIRVHLERAVQSSLTGSLAQDPGPHVETVEIVQGSSIRGYDFGAAHHIIKIWVAQPRLVSVVQELLAPSPGSRSMPWCVRPLPDCATAVGLPAKARIPPSAKWTVYECNIAFDQRFLIDVDGRGNGWCTCPAGKYILQQTSQRRTWSTLEASIDVNDLRIHPVEGEFDKMTDKRVVSFDIECAGFQGSFPVPSGDPVIQICNSIVHNNEAEPLRFGFSLGSANGTITVEDEAMNREHMATYRRKVQEWGAACMTVRGHNQPPPKPETPELVSAGWGDDQPIT